MSILVNLTPTEEENLNREASRSGLAPHEFIQKVLRQHLAPADSIDEMNSRILKWQEEDQTPILPRPAMRSGLTPTAALFQQWAEEDAKKTEAEVEADDTLWEDYQQGINNDRENTGMRTLF